MRPPATPDPVEDRCSRGRPGELSRIGRAGLGGPRRPLRGDEVWGALSGVGTASEEGNPYMAKKSAQRKTPMTLRGKIARNLAESIYCAKNGARWRVDAHGNDHDMRRYLIYLNTETAEMLAALLKDYGDYPLAEMEAGLKPLFAGMTADDIRQLQQREKLSGRERAWLGKWEEAHTHRQELTVRATDLLVGLERAVKEVKLPAGTAVSLREGYRGLRAMLDVDGSPLAQEVLEDMDEVTLARGCLERSLRAATR